MKRNIIIAVIMLSISTTVSALSIELGAGLAEQSTLLGETKVDNNTFTIKASYEFVYTWNAELSYEYYNKSDDNYDTGSNGIVDESVLSTAILLGLKKSYPLNNRFTLNVRGGYSLWNIDYDVEFKDDGIYNFSYDDTGSNYYWGLGVEFYVTPRFYVTTSYTRLTMNILKPDEKIQSYNRSNKFLSVFTDKENNITNISFGIGYIF